MFRRLIEFSVDRPRVIIAFFVILLIATGLQMPRIKVDTDPENMLSEKEFVRVFHHGVKKEFALYDFIVLGIVNEIDPNGVFNVSTLNTIHALTQKIKSIDGVIAREVISPATKDNIRQGDIGTVIFEWLMKSPISTQEEAIRIRDEALDNPMFRDTMVSENGRALCLYVPIESKDMSYRISQQIKTYIDELAAGTPSGGTAPADDRYYITGLPVAEDTFGVEMFVQMAISAPLAGLVIFLLMLAFFRNISLVISPMLLAIGTVVMTMGLLIGFGFPVHIMSSMIPIFLMPIAVLDSVHILSEFSDKYPGIRDRRKTVLAVMDELFKPMLFTSLTSAVGFFSLSFAPIPPVQTFGVFVAIGVMIAWILTMTFIPAYIGLMGEKGLEKMAVARGSTTTSRLDRYLAAFGRFAYARARLIILITVITVLISLYGITRISVNDNPVRWFTARHPIRVADKVLNDHFGGTYTAYLVLESKDKDRGIFKEPAMLRYVEDLQRYLAQEGDVGKSTSLADVVKKVYYELLGGDRAYNVIPDTRQAVSQCLISYENSHKPDDLWHFATPDLTKLNIWLQLKSGDNKKMAQVRDQVDHYMREHTPPFDLTYNWAGKTYINLIWQNKMVLGMLNNFLGSFIIVFFMMAFLFRSPLKGLISMVPLTVTILFIYSLLGYIGKDYDMPVAVLSALTLGLSIDFAIHFIQRAREIYQANQSWQETCTLMFQEPGRAITRNALVIAIGFLPLLFAPLVPYKTVGFFMFAIMLVSSVATLFLLPAIMTMFPKVAFEERKEILLCNCGHCVIISLAVAAAIAYVLTGYTAAGWNRTTLVCIAIVVIMSGICSRISRHTFCIRQKQR